jgi:hypothetical protein
MRQPISSATDILSHNRELRAIDITYLCDELKRNHSFSWAKTMKKCNDMRQVSFRSSRALEPSRHTTHRYEKNPISLQIIVWYSRQRQLLLFSSEI